MKASARLVTNGLNTDFKNLQTFTVNLTPGKTRLDTLEGRSYTVVPMVLLTEGVHAGSSGPLLYNAEELGKTPQIWNHKPVVVYHPEINGQGVSACDVSILNSRKVGLIMNVKFSGGRLTGEAWMDMDRTKAVDERVTTAIEKNEMMELSTGLFIDLEQADGEYKGEKYVGIARNFRADHLALLPDKVGACSTKDGAGFLRNHRKENTPAWAGLKTLLAKIGLGELVGNELSFDNIETALCGALRVKLNISENPLGSPVAWPWVQSVYTNFFIYEYDGKLFRLDYASTDTGVSLSEEEPVEVNRVTEYRTVGGAYVGNTSDQPREITMNKQQMVDAIIANKASGWSEADRPALLALADAQVTNIHKGVLSLNAAPPAPVAPVAPVVVPAAPVIPVVQQPAPTVTTNQNQTAPLTLDQYIAQAPAGMQDVLRNSLSLHAEEKSRLIETITKNSRNSFTKEDLGNRPLGELRSLAALAAPVDAPAYAPYYAGMAPAPVTNEGEVECLELPALDFSKK